MKEKKWAKERNFSKYCLKCIRTQASGIITTGVLTPDEVKGVEHIINRAKELLHVWDRNNYRSKWRCCK